MFPITSSKPDGKRAPAGGIAANREAADGALLGMLSRARRHEIPLLLVELRWASARRAPQMLPALAAQLRASDLGWFESAERLWLLLEWAPEARPVLARLEELVRAEGERAQLRAARFPQQGLTLAALAAALGDVRADELDAVATGTSGAAIEDAADGAAAPRVWRRVGEAAE